MTTFPSKERVERDGVLVYAEGDEIPASDTETLKAQGYNPNDATGASTVTVTERIERDGVLVAAEGEEIPAEAAERLGIKGGTKAAKSDEDEAKPAKRTAKRS
jgi:hypothetical protein